MLKVNAWSGTTWFLPFLFAFFGVVISCVTKIKFKQSHCYLQIIVVVKVRHCWILERGTKNSKCLVHKDLCIITNHVRCTREGSGFTGVSFSTGRERRQSMSHLTLPSQRGWSTPRQSDPCRQGDPPGQGESPSTTHTHTHTHTQGEQWSVLPRNVNGRLFCWRML